MPDIDNQELNEDDSGMDGPESPATSKEGGYSILFTVTPNGFTVDGPRDLEPAPQGETEEENPIPDLTEALKHVISIVKDNPIHGDVQKAFADGFSQNEKKSAS